MVVDALQKVGAARSIVIDEHGVILAGNGVTEAAAEAGITKVRVIDASGDELIAVRRTGLTDEQKVALAIYDNRGAELAEWNIEQLVQDQANGIDLTPYFFAEELAKLLPADGTAGLTDPDEVPETRATDIVLGDLFELGRHRLLCGDSTSSADVARLMGGKIVDIAFTSPPYALGKSIKLSGNTSMSKGESAYVGHDDDPGLWLSLMGAWFAASEPFVSAWVVNVQPLAGNKRALMEWLYANRERLVDIVTWDKGHAAPAMAAGVLGSRYEWIVIWGKNGSSRTIPFSSWRGTIQSVVEIPPQRNNEFADVHGATMPVALAEWAVGTLCDKVRTVYDPFSGTGTATIAAERLGRSSFAMELSPSYCQIAIDRWEAFTGLKAIKVDA